MHGNKQQKLFELEVTEPRLGEYPYFDRLKAGLSPAYFATSVPDRDGYITLIDDMGYEFDLNIVDGLIRDIVCILENHE